MREDLPQNLDKPQKVKELITTLGRLEASWGLDKLIAEGREEATFYIDIWIGVDALIKYVNKTPENKYHLPFTHSLTMMECEKYNFTPENSRFAKTL
jgi:hypothetical protein